MTTIKNIGTKNGLYVVRVEKSVLEFDDWNDDYVSQIKNDVKYILVYDYQAFERWLEKLHAESGVCKIEYKKLSECVTAVR